MKRTAKILSLGLVAFMLTGCNLFSKVGNDEVSFQEFNFKSEDKLTTVEKAEFLYRAKEAVLEYSELSVTEHMVSSDPVMVMDYSVKNEIKSYSNDFVVSKETTTGNMSYEGISYDIDESYERQWYRVGYLDGEEQKQAMLIYAKYKDSVNLSKGAETVSAYKTALNYVDFAFANDSEDVYHTNDGFIVVASEVSEGHDYIPYDTGVKEQIIIHKAQSVWSFNKEYQLVKYTNIEEQNSNRDSTGAWYKKVTMLIRNTTVMNFKYGNKAPGDSGEIFSVFSNPYIESLTGVQTFKYSVHGSDYAETTSGELAEVDYSKQKIASNKLRYSGLYHLSLDETFNAFAFKMQLNYYSDFKNAAVSHNSPYLTSANTEEFETFSAGGVPLFVYKYAATSLYILIEFDIVISSLQEVSFENAKISVVA